MSPEHFKEVLGVVAMTSKMNQREISEYLEVDRETVRSWKNKGVRPYRVSLIMAKFRKLIKGE